ncbi:MAG: ABC transporter ATP-binding protein/permease [Gammaproteobacteria bacterium]|nr:ABC transporter ATP-binding protein/permease [Gammaproteobacteria bacterium]
MTRTSPLTITGHGQFAKVWALVKPYWQSEEKGAAWLLLAAVVGLNLGLVYLLVLLNEWNNAFYNSLQDKNFDAFKAQLAKFAVIAFVYIAVAVYQIYLRQLLQIRWRRWLTGVFLQDWLANRCYYRIELRNQGTDNPDQRIQEDLQTFTEGTLALALDFMRSVVTLLSFITILWGLSGPLSFTLGGHDVTLPGYMVWFAIGYAVLGTFITHKLGRPLIALNFQQQRFEADLRYGLVRLRENAEGVAFYRGEDDERRALGTRFEHVVDNFVKLMNRNKRLGWFTNMYDQLAVIFPFMVGAPRYFGGQIQLGGLMQIASAFGRVQDSLSWFVSAYASIAAWKATVDRLTSFHEAIQDAQSAAAEGRGVNLQSDAADASLAAEHLTLELPDGRVLLDDAAVTLAPRENLLLTGPSGSGKSTLFRALAGIWPFGRGRVRVPAGARTLFLPQRPYLPLGTLREVVCYPAGAASASDADITAALTACELGHLVPALDEDHRWAQRLSPGEQQRLAFARALLYRPDWLFLDEATSALDDALERKLYELVRDRLPDTTVISIAHRPTVAAWHARRLQLEPNEASGGRLVSAPI